MVLQSTFIRAVDPHSFLRIRIWIQLIISMRSRIQQPFKCGSGSGSSLTKFVTNFFNMPIRIQEGKWMRIHADPDSQPWCYLRKFLVSWVSELWIYILNLTPFESFSSYIYKCRSGSVFGIRIHKAPEYGSNSGADSATAIVWEFFRIFQI